MRPSLCFLNGQGSNLILVHFLTYVKMKAIL